MRPAIKSSCIGNADKLSDQDAGFSYEPSLKWRNGLTVHSMRCWKISQTCTNLLWLYAIADVSYRLLACSQLRHLQGTFDASDTLCHGIRSRALPLQSTSHKRLRLLRTAHGRMVPCRLPVRYTTAFAPVDVRVTVVTMLLGVHAISCGSHTVYALSAQSTSQVPMILSPKQRPSK